MKRTLCLFLALILAVGICFSAPVTITASAAEGDVVSVTVGGTTTSYDTFDAAITAAQSCTDSDKAVVKLLADIAMGDTAISGGVFTIDLNGFELSGTVSISLLSLTGSANVTITDSGTDGAIRTNNKAIRARDTSIVTIDGGIIQSAADSYPIWFQSTGNLTVNDGVIIGGLYGINIIKGIATINGGNIRGTSEGIKCSGTLTVYGGTVTSDHIAVLVDSSSASVTINGGSFTGGSYAVNGWSSCSATINGGEFSGGEYDLGGMSSVKVNGATFPEGLSVKDATLNAILGSGYAYWAGDTMLAPADDATGITDKGEITVKAACTHESGNKSYTNNGDDHTYIYSCCNLTVTEDHNYTDCVCPCDAESHTFTETSNGFCTACEAYQPAVDSNSDGYYEIENAGQLFWFANHVNTVDRTASAVLVADIDLENRPWTPIGETGEENNNFCGVFDGQGHTIRGLNVEGSENGVGFFGEVRTGTVKNFTIYGNVVVNTEVDYVGGVIGSICGVNGETDLERNGAFIQNITSFVNVTAKAHGIGMIGGFVGYANHQSLIEQCAWYGTFDAGSYRVDTGAGGFIGKIQDDTSEVTIRNCGAYGTIKTGYEKNSYNNYPTIYMGGFLSSSNTGAQTTLENCLFAGRFERGENLTDEARLGAFGTLRSVNAIKNCYYLGDDGLAAVHSDSDLKPGSDNVEITTVTGEELRNNTIATQLGEYWTQDVHYPIPKDTKAHSDSATYTYTDNGDGTHKATCTECGYVEVDNEAHTYKNGKCTAEGCGYACTHETPDENGICTVCCIAEGTCGEKVTWVYDKATTTLTISGSGAMANYTGYDMPWYNYQSNITKVVIENGVTTIGDYAFWDCSTLTSVTILDRVTTIGESAFSGCFGLTSVTIPYSVTTIGDGAFSGCTSLTSVTIPDNVTTIGDGAFSSCTELIEIKVAEGNTNYLSVDGILFSADKTELLCYPAGKKGNYEILTTVTKIAPGAFSGNTSLESVIIPDSVTTIDDGAFMDCTALTSVTIPDSVTTIGSYAFQGCTSLASVTIGDRVTTIGWQTFYDCTALTSVTIGKGVTEIGDCAFESCTSLTTIEIPDSVTAIGESAFYDCTSLTSVTIGKGVTEIGNEAFYGCTKILLFVNKNNTDVQNYATDNNINYVFDGSGELEKLTFTPIYKEADNENSEITGYSVTAHDKTISGALTIPSEFNGKRVTEIGNNAFANCESLTSVVIPDSVGSLGEMAFYSCDSLETVTLSSNITVIPNEAFAYCEALKTLPITENVTSIGESAFYASENLGSVSLSNVTIGSNAFFQCGITELTLKNCKLNDASVFINNEIKVLTLLKTNIPDEMFDGNSYIKTLVAEDSVLGSWSFRDCTELENVTVSGGEIKSDAFWACPSLKTVTIDNIDSVGEYAFYNCQALKTVEVNATEISKYAFSMCASLENVKLSDGVEVIGNAVFAGCTSLAELELPETVTEIGKWVFNGCNLLTELVIPESVAEISYGAFVGCSNLKYIFFEGTEDAQKTIGDALETNAKIHYGSSTHTFNENYTVDVEPTCTEKGRESQHCKYCDLTRYERPVKENGHTSVNGGTEGAHTICDVCEDVLSAEHEFASKITTEPTYTKEGIKTFTCECGYSYEEVIPCLVPGEIKAEEAESNSFSATVVDINSIVTKLQLTEEEKTLIEQGADMKIVFKLSDIGATINTPEKEAIFKALTNEKIAVFLDIQLVKQIANNSVNVQKLNDLIKVTVELPAELVNKDGNIKRSYSVLRYHDGDETKVTTLNAKFDEATGTLTFETDRFSTYAIVYSDVVVSDGEGAPGTPDSGDGEVSTPEAPKEETTPGTPETPKDETTPGTPETPKEETTPGTPETPKDETIPGTPETPKDEATPGTPETPKDDVSSDKTDDSVTNDKNDASSETGTNDKNDTSKDDVPKAGVISTTSIWLGAMALSGFGALLVSKKKKEND